VNAPQAVADWCREQGYGEISGVKPVGGGCINNGARLTTSSGQTLFLKQNGDAPQDMFAREKEGLEALADAGSLRVPLAYFCGQSYLVLEDLKPSRPAATYWEDFGRGLATLHATTSDQFGFAHDNYLGSTPQPNPWTKDGYTFYGEHRLRFQARLARHKRWLDDRALTQIDSIIRRLPRLVPEQPASLLHGDLWSGNATSTADGQPALIDPAAHYGWAEAELGMTMLFGGFPAAFYDAYEATHSLTPGWRDRLSHYNLYHLLNHLNLFGAIYLDQVKLVIERFA
jgi:protein-ribulosamine 3-kinase